MMELKKNELKKISGGVSIWAIIGALAGLIFGIGVFEGYTRNYVKVEILNAKEDSIGEIVSCHIEDSNEGYLIGKII